MAHVEQQTFIKNLKVIFPNYFQGAMNILEIGSQDINGTVRDYFEGENNYLGVDIGRGKSVDFIVPGEDLQSPSDYYDIIISTECFEHTASWDKIFLNIIRLVKTNGLVILTFAGYGRPSHGTIDSGDPESSPYTNQVYNNIKFSDVIEKINLDYFFSEFSFITNNKSHDTYFYGVRSDNAYDEISEVKYYESRLSHARGQLGQALKIIQEKDREIKNKVQLIEEKDREIKNKVQLIEEKDREIKNKALLIEEKHSQINKLEILVDKKLEKINHLNSEIDNMKNYIQSLLLSTSWKITKPFRDIKNKLIQ